jgi:hypothetical protein
MSIQKLTIVRSGQFHIHTFGKNHCGTGHSFDIRYHMTAVCSPKLDRRGFEFDQINIDKFFQGVKRTSMSCEKLTEALVGKLRQHILKENPGCEIHNLELSLSPQPFMASMGATWASDKETRNDPSNSG